MSLASRDHTNLRDGPDALDNGSNKSAIVACNKLLKKTPASTLVKESPALKTLALVRSQKFEEALVLCDEVLAAKPTDDGTLSAMMHVLRGLGKHADMVTMFDNAYKQQPGNEELGAQTFFAHVRTGHWKESQQIATKLHKQFQEDRYLYWSVMCALLQANDPATLPAMRIILYKLAHRIVGQSPTPSYKNPDRFYLHLYILRDLESFDEAHTLLESDVGKAICSASLVCNELRRDIWRLRGLWREEGERAQRRIIDDKDRNWLEFLSVLDGTFSSVASPDSETASSIPSEDRTFRLEQVEKVRQVFEQVAEEDGSKDRSGLLALVELEKRNRAHGLSLNADAMVELLKRYLRDVGEKTCCFEDLRPCLQLGPDDLQRWTEFLNTFSNSSSSPAELKRTINIQKLLRFNLSQSELTVDLELSRASLYLKLYLGGLDLGKSLPTTELQHADDLAIMAAHALVNLWEMTGDDKHLFTGAVVLEFALTKSKHSFQMRLMLVRIYRLLGAPSLALSHFHLTDVKQIQNDTLSHFILSRASTFSLAATGDLTYPSECLEASQIYISNAQETSEFIVRAFTSEKYSQIPDFITFEDRLDNSLQRDITKMEHVRMRITHEQINSDLIDMEVIELKFIFDRIHYDNRDFDVLPNYQPHCQSTLGRQTTLLGKEPGLGWLWVFLKVYIKAFQQASDLDDTVEDKLLVGDRPKTAHNADHKVPLRQRLTVRKQEELDELTAQERAFLDYATALADWLEPYHDYVRPPAATVLAEAAKQNELKAGHPLKKLDEAANGKKTTDDVKVKETPAVKDAPEYLGRFFEDMKVRFQEAAGKSLPPELLHTAAIAQEALVLLSLESLRFKPASVVKIHKLGAIVQSLKNVRAQAVVVLKDMSESLLALAEKEGKVEQRTAFVDAATTLVKAEIDHDFVLGVAKNLVEARAKVLEGVGKGIAKICALHA